MAFQNSASNNPIREVTDSVVGLLELGPDDRLLLEATAAQVWLEYSEALAFQKKWRSAKVQRGEVGKLIGHMGHALEALEKLAPACLEAIADLGRWIPPERKEPVDIEASVDSFERLIWGGYQFLERLAQGPGRPDDFALLRAVKTTVALLESSFSCAVKIRWNRNTDLSPAPRSKGAEALVYLLKALPGRPTQTAILNMVQKVRRSGKARDPRNVVRDTHRYDFDENDDMIDKFPEKED